MEFPDLMSLTSNDARAVTIVTTVPSQKLSFELWPSVQNVYQERQTKQLKTYEAWNPPKNVKILPKPEPTQNLRILSCKTIKSADLKVPSTQGASAQERKASITSSVPDKFSKPKTTKRKHLGNLDDDKLKLVTTALKNIGNPLKSMKKTVYDGATKTRIIYKVIYPKDLNLSDTSQITLKGEDVSKRESGISVPIEHPVSRAMTVDDFKSEAPAKVTRSGRTVKLPRGRGPQLEDKSAKIKKQKFVNMLTCLRCHAKFSGASKINRHYEQMPTHKPNTTHSNLFKCFLDVMKSSSVDEKSYMFVEQLEELIVKIKNMLPCMINNIDSSEGKLCCINEDLGKMLDMEPGKYNISVDDGIHCYEHGKDKCKHTPKVYNLGCTTDLNKPSQLWVAKHNEEIAMMPSEDTECARTHSVDKWPAIKKRIKRFIPLSSRAQETSPTGIERKIIAKGDTGSQILNNEIPAKESENESKDSNTKLFKVPEAVHSSALNINTEAITMDHLKPYILPTDPHQENDTVPEETNKPLPSSNYKYHSSHFDIRSSPIKSSTTNFNKIQIKGDNFPVFVKLTDEEHFPPNNTVDQKCNRGTMHIDINGLLSQLDSRDLGNETLTQSSLSQQNETNEFYETASSSRPSSMSLSTVQSEVIQKEYSTSSRNNLNFFNMSQSSMRHNDKLLSSGNTQLPQAEGLAGLCANENNLDNSRMGLQLLDHLSSDCLSFSENELRNASLDLPLDLFHFNNTE